MTQAWAYLDPLTNRLYQVERAVICGWHTTARYLWPRPWDKRTAPPPVLNQTQLSRAEAQAMLDGYAVLMYGQGRRWLRACRVCGCTDDDCEACIRKTGAPCWWVQPGLCSACAME